MTNKAIFPSALTIKFHRPVKIIVTDVEIMEASEPQLPVPIGSGYRTKALWDTGATNSVIAASTALALGLKPTSKRFVEHGGGKELKNTYVVNIGLPNRVLVKGVFVTEMGSILKGTCGAIIGMDIITKGDFTITNPGNETWMTYRYPSLAQTDYVKEENSKRFAGVGRNDPCPCGAKDASGKPIKFKKCHGR